MLNLGPFNYPFNETYCTLIPAILMGNSVVMKLPNVGCLAHICTMEAYAKVRAEPQAFCHLLPPSPAISP